MDHLAALAREGTAFAAVLPGADLEARVPTCGDWTLRELTLHLGRVHRWAGHCVRVGKPQPEDTEAVPPDGELRPWLEAGLADLAEALDDPDRPCWTFAGPGTARWWQRRQAQETLVHRVDAQRTQGPAGPVDPALAADGVDEVVTVFHPRQVRLGRAAPPPAALSLVAPTGRWTLDGPGDPIEVRGPADALLLLLWRRTDLADPRLTLLGDRDVAETVLAGPLTP